MARVTFASEISSLVAVWLL